MENSDRAYRQGWRQRVEFDDEAAQRQNTPRARAAASAGSVRDARDMRDANDARDARDVDAVREGQGDRSHATSRGGGANRSEGARRSPSPGSRSASGDRRSSGGRSSSGDRRSSGSRSLSGGRSNRQAGSRGSGRSQSGSSRNGSSRGQRTSSSQQGFSDAVIWRNRIIAIVVLIVLVVLLVSLVRCVAGAVSGPAASGSSAAVSTTASQSSAASAGSTASATAGDASSAGSAGSASEASATGATDATGAAPSDATASDGAASATSGATASGAAASSASPVARLSAQVAQRISSATGKPRIVPAGEGVEDQWVEGGRFTTGDAELDQYIKDFCDASTNSELSREENAFNLYCYAVWREYVERDDNQYPTGADWDIVFAKQDFVENGGNCYNQVALAEYVLKYFGYYDAQGEPCLILRQSGNYGDHGLVFVTDADGRKCLCDPAFGADGWMLDADVYTVRLFNVGQDPSEYEVANFEAIELAPWIDA